MQKEDYNVIGVMSGTSLDGIDLANIAFSHSGGTWKFKITDCETVGYSRDWIEVLKSAVDFSAEQLRELNEKYTSHLSDVISDFISKNDINPDAVCSHGHTILHQPANGITLQIGNLPQLASNIARTVVCDFRVDDVLLGGQGAPLVPIGDSILFSEYDYCLNLGGFSNISFEHEGKRIAFDISPVNTVLNFYAGKLGFDYDNKGEVSSQGSFNPILFEQLNQLPFYRQPFPKSLGFEFVKTTILPMCNDSMLAVPDILRTFTEHVALQISLALPIKTGKMLITGGGAYNDFLIERIKSYLPEITLTIPDRKILEFKEALIFGLLGVLKLRNEVNVLSSVTGAAHDHSSGKIYIPNQTPV